MIEPKRLLDGGGTELEQMLISAGRSARPSRASRWKTGLVLALASIGVAPRLAAAALSRAGGSGAIAAKWLALGLGVATTGAAVGTLVARNVHGDRAPAGEPAHAVIRLQAPERLALAEPGAAAHLESIEGEPGAKARLDSTESEPVAGEHVAEAAQAPAAATPSVAPPRFASGSRGAESRRHGTVRPGSGTTSAQVDSPPAKASPNAMAPQAEKPAAPALPERATPSKGAPALSDELKELDRARAAVAAGDARGALSELDRYGRDFPNGMLRQEAMVLRIEALHAAGDDATARSLVDRFTAAYPDSAHARRLRSLVAGP